MASKRRTLKKRNYRKKSLSKRMKTRTKTPKYNKRKSKVKSQKKGKMRTRCGRIICYLNQEEGLYPHSYDINKHNGKDFLQCVEIDPNNLKRILDEEDHPKIFIANPEKCKVVEALDKDENGNQVIPFKLNV